MYNIQLEITPKYMNQPQETSITRTHKVSYKFTSITPRIYFQINRIFTELNHDWGMVN